MLPLFSTFSFFEVKMNSEVSPTRERSTVVFCLHERKAKTGVLKIGEVRIRFRLGLL